MWGKSIAAIVLGFPAAVAITGVLAYFGPGTLEARTMPTLLMFFPIWVSTISLTYLARSALRASAWLLAISMIGFGALRLARALHWVELPA